MKEFFENRKLTGAINIKMDDTKGTWAGDKGKIVAHIIAIAEEYMKDGYTLTLRQLYYQLVARDVIPNHDKVYAKISAIKDDVVYSGLVDWRAFEDRGRVPKQAYYEDSVSEALMRTLQSYKLDRQLNQPKHIEVWTEKDAISSILASVANPYTIMLVVNKGYTSSTAIYGAYKRFAKQMLDGIPVKILYFGDHDPSGLDMIRDIRDRLMFMFTKGESFKSFCLTWWDAKNTLIGNDWNVYTLCDAYPDEYPNLHKIMDDEQGKYDDMWDEAVVRWWIDQNDMFEIIPVGLTMDQINHYKPPHNPAKITDPRAKDYVVKFGQVSWEVDALSPKTMQDIVRSAILDHMDMKTYHETKAQEKKDLDKLKTFIDTEQDED